MPTRSFRSNSAYDYIKFPSTVYLPNTLQHLSMSRKSSLSHFHKMGFRARVCHPPTHPSIPPYIYHITPPIHPSIHPPIHPFICHTNKSAGHLPAHLSIDPFTHLSTHLPIHSPMDMTHLSIHLASIHWFIYYLYIHSTAIYSPTHPSIHLPIHLPTHLYIYTPIHSLCWLLSIQ